MIPFSTGEDLKNAASQLSISMDIDNLQSPLENTEDELRDILSDTVYDALYEHWNNPPDPTDADKDTYLKYLQAGMVNLALYHHFIFLQINIDDAGVTTYKSENKTTAFDYQTREAKENLLKTGWNKISRLIDKMTADNYDPWLNSSPFFDMKALLFDGYRDFNKYFDISNNAAFYLRCRYLIKNEVMDDYLTPRVKDISAVTDDKLKALMKKFAAYKTVELAIMRFDYPFLPEAIRSALSTDRNRKNRYKDQETVREKVVNGIARKAESYLREIDLHRHSESTTVVDNDDFEEKYKVNNDVKNKYYNGL